METERYFICVLNIQFRCTIKTHKIFEQNIIERTTYERKSYEFPSFYHSYGLNFSEIAKLLHLHSSSISREWKRHLKEEAILQSGQREAYYITKSHCGRKRMLEIDHNLRNTINIYFSQEVRLELRLKS